MRTEFRAVQQYYVSATVGSDSNSGIAPEAPWPINSTVHDLGSASVRSFDPSGVSSLQIRTSTTAFAAEDVTPAWTTFTAAYTVNCRYVQIQVPTGTYFYVDNAAVGTNAGTSWTNAWQSFADINWTTVAAATNPVVYISGGVATKTYTEQMTVGASGTASNWITIDVGANSPAPTGHAGTVIIDGGISVTKGIWISALSYIRVNGRDGSGNYRLQIQNIVSDNNPTKCCVLVNNSCDHIYIDYVKCIANTSRGLYLNGCTNSRARGCDVRTGTIDLAVQTDPMYCTGGVDNVVENNIFIQGNQDTALLHIDPLLVNNETRLIVRNNWFECGPGFVDTAEIAFIANRITEYLLFYNNVVIGSDADEEKACIFAEQDGYTGLYYIWNNTFIATHATGGVVSLFGFTADRIGAFKNNLCYSPNGVLIYYDQTPTITPSSKIDYNCLYRAAGTNVAILTDGFKTWAQWQALGYDASGVNADPLFNIADQYRLNDAGSPCIGAGVDLSAYMPATDRDGNPRVAGDWSIGAYEYTPGG